MTVDIQATSSSSSPRQDFDSTERLHNEVILGGLCTHCGTCVGLSAGKWHFEETFEGPLPTPPPTADSQLPDEAWHACPGKGLPYPELTEFIFGRAPDTWLAGVVRKSYVGHALDPVIRRRGASGGIITAVLLYLLETDRIDGAVVLKHGTPRPWLSEPVIATTADEIRESSQSVYIPTPVNTILQDLEEFEGRVAFVGLPDQVASVRQLQKMGHPVASKIDVVLGPYVGTAIHLAGITSYLRAHGVDGLESVEELRYREGEWPGYLYVRTVQGEELRAPKFYYNYLIPFYITRASLLSVDFTNELTDLSVGDAWSPALEAEGGGHSVVLARSQLAEDLLQEMREAGRLSLARFPVREALSMHGHMIDFKKRGAFLRIQGRKFFGKPAPDYGLWPNRMPFTRILVELVISGIFLMGRTAIARRILEWIPIQIIGPIFDTLRQRWKNFSKPTKRQGLWGLTFEVMDSKRRSSGE